MPVHKLPAFLGHFEPQRRVPNTIERGKFYFHLLRNPIDLEIQFTIVQPHLVIFPIELGEIHFGRAAHVRTRRVMRK